MNKETEWISRSEAGRRLKVTHTMIGKYAIQGAPTREDKRVPWPELQTWVKRNIAPSRSGSWLHRELKRQAEQSNAADSDVKAEARRELLEEIRHEGLRVLPELCLRLGLPMPAAVAMPDILDSLIFGLGGAVVGDDTFGDCLETLEPLPELSNSDLRKLGKTFGLRPALKAWRHGADELIDRCDLAYWHMQEKHPAAVVPDQAAQ
jgi:hypothetical protein